MLKRDREKSHSSSFSLKGRVIFFATGNLNKFQEARSVLTERGIAVGMLRVKALEIQSDVLSEIAIASVIDAGNYSRLPVIVEDAGLFVEVLKGFPGPYSAYVYKTIGNRGLLKLMDGQKNRKANFQSAIAYYDGEAEPICFLGQVSGKITQEEKKGEDKAGFGFDPIFEPSAAHKTFAEMSIEEKNSFSHRANAMRKFAEWYEKLKRI